MTSKERVLRSIEFNYPDKVPVFMFNKDRDKSDIVFVAPSPPLNFKPTNLNESEWGFIWERLDDTMGQPKNIVIGDIERAEEYKEPNGNDKSRYRFLQEEINCNKDKFIFAGWGISGFGIISFLCGFEQTLEYLYLDPEKLKIVCDKVFGFEMKLIENLLNYDIDGINFYDDWGMQKTLMINPAMWREFFKPYYKKQFDIIKKAGKKIYFHSCGYVADIIGDLIEIGVDVFNFNQPEVMGIEYLAENFGGKTCFVCPVDLQKVAIKADKKTIYDYTKKLIDKLGCYNGGFIGYVEEYHSIGLSDANYRYSYEAIVDYGKDVYKK